MDSLHSSPNKLYMNKSSLISARNKIIQHYQESFIVQNDEFLNGQYTMVSANLSNYLPAIDAREHINIFTELLIHKKISHLEQGSEEALNFLTVEGLSNETLNSLKEKPFIICTFHTGSYRLINLFLAKNNIPFALVTGKTILEKEGDSFISLYKRMTPNNTGNSLKIIDAETPQSGLQMLRELKKGRNLLLYIDGNSGAGTVTSKNDNRCIIQFLDQRIFARKGIGYLAHTANVPILTAVNYRESWNDVRLMFHDPIIPDPTIDRALFARDTTQKIYDLVSETVQKFPEQWEAWLYLHKTAHVSPSDLPSNEKYSGTQVEFNLRHYGIFKIESSSFLFKKSTYTSYPIDPSTYDILNNCMRHPVPVQQIESCIFTQLHQNGVLLYL